MGYPTKLQCIQRQGSQQFYVNFPASLAQAIDLQKGEQFEWTIVDKGRLLLSRQVVPPDPVPLKKKPPFSKT
jgi:antitoxin component of MazEF toxin-antitoxin module